MWTKIRSFLKILGPGLITGASDNDPAGISTYSVAGARTGYTFLWLGILSLPLMIAVQDMSARVGAVKEEGLGYVIKECFGKWWLTIAMIALLISNIATIGADIAGVASACSLLSGIGDHWFVAPTALLIILVEVFGSYRTFARILTYLTIILFAYVFAGLFAKPNWAEVMLGTFVPYVRFDRQSLEIMVGMLGTTISPYMFFWQSSEEIEEIESAADQQDVSERSERRRLIDTSVGMFYAVLVFYFIVLTSAATLHREHITITSAAEAANALKPVAGEYAFILFAVGLIGSGLIAIPVLAGATAYPMAEWLEKPEGLSKDIHQARLFYIILAASVIVGMVIALLPINPIDALFYSQVLMGLLTPILLIMLMLITRNKTIMGEENVNRPFFNIFGWLAVAVTVFADVAVIWSWIG